MATGQPMSNLSSAGTSMDSSSRNRQAISKHLKIKESHTLPVPSQFITYQRSPLSAEAYNATASVRENLTSASCVQTSPDTSKVTPTTVSLTPSGSTQAIATQKPKANKKVTSRPAAGRKAPLKNIREVQPEPLQPSFHFRCLRDIYPISTRVDSTNDEVLIAEALLSPHTPSHIQMEILDGDYTNGYDAYMNSTLKLETQQSRGQKRKEHE